MSNSTHELIGEAMLFIIGCSLGFMAGLIVMYLLDSWFFNKLIGEERMFWTHKVWEQKQQVEEYRSELKHAYEDYASQAVKLTNYIDELEAEIRKEEENYYKSDRFEEELDRYYMDEDNGAEEAFAKLEAEELCRECERDEPCLRHNFLVERPKEWWRIDVEDEGIRYWWYTSRYMEGATGATKESPPPDAPSDRVFRTDEERRASPLFQHICI